MKNRIQLAAGLIFAIAVLAYVSDLNQAFSIVTILAIIGYFTGLLAIFLGIFFSLFSFLVSLPVISSLYGFLVLTLGKIHYMLFSVLLKKTLKKSKAYRKTELKMKNSSAYKKSSAIFNRVLKRAGIASPHRVKFVEVRECGKCGKLIPADGRFCPYCRHKQ